MLHKSIELLLSFLGIPIYWYALIIVSGIIIAMWLSSREAVRVGLKADDVTDFSCGDYRYRLLVHACITSCSIFHSILLIQSKYSISVQEA